MVDGWGQILTIASSPHRPAFKHKAIKWVKIWPQPSTKDKSRWSKWLFSQGKYGWSSATL